MTALEGAFAAKGGPFKAGEGRGVDVMLVWDAAVHGLTGHLLVPLALGTSHRDAGSHLKGRGGHPKPWLTHPTCLSHATHESHPPHEPKGDLQRAPDDPPSCLSWGPQIPLCRCRHEAQRRWEVPSYTAVKWTHEGHLGAELLKCVPWAQSATRVFGWGPWDGLSLCPSPCAYSPSLSLR